MTARHPAHDVLADLAAEVLPDGEARVVEAHVIGCPRCADLLADAERVRQLLMSADPGPMPATVWDRIAFSLAQESASPRPAAASAAQPAVQEATTGQWQQFAARADERHPVSEAFPQVTPAVQGSVDPEAADPETTGLDGPDAVRSGRSVRPVRRGTPSLRSRRQIRSEDRAMSMLRYLRPLGIAAAVLVLAGAAGLAVVKLPLGGSSTDTAATSGGGDSVGGSTAELDRGNGVPQEAAAAGDGGGTLTVASGTNYTTQDLAARAALLTPSVRQSAYRASSSASAGASASAAPGASAGGGLTPRDLAPSVSGNASLTDPVKLAECLAELNAGDDVQPIAIDFARYEGQDAAIILIAARDGGYEVWAVARTCGAGSGGQLAFQTFTSP